MNDKWKIVIYILVTIGLLCVPCSFISIGQLFSAIAHTNKNACTEDVQAILIDKHQYIDDDGDVMWKGEYIYTVDGIDYQYFSSISYGSRNSVKDIIDLKYNPKDPYVTYDKNEEVFGVTFSIIGGIILVVEGIVLVPVFAVKKNKTKKGISDNKQNNYSK